MAKSRGSSKPQGSAAVRRREQQRQREQESGRREPQRQRQQESNRRNQPQQARNQRRMQPKSNRRTSVLVGGVLLVIALVVVIFIFISSQSSSSGSGRTVAPASVVNAVTKVDPSLLSQIGTGGVANPFKAVPGSPPVLTGPTGKPEVFFYGAEFCPYCAAERWSIIVALSRFGTFHNLGETTSSSTDVYPNTSTFTFYQSSYSSSSIDFVPIENEDRQNNILQTPTAAEQQLLTRYNVGGYPFMDIGDRYLIMGPSYDAAVLRTNPQDPNSQALSQQDIANQLSTENTLSKNVLGVANYLTAAICSITNNQPSQPSQVCKVPFIQSIEASLSKTSQSNGPSGGSPLLAFAESPALDVRRP